MLADDIAPSFGSATVADMTFTNGVEFFTKTSDVSTYGLPAATGGNGTLSYTLSPALPKGIVFTEGKMFTIEGRYLTGTPAEVAAAKTYTYTVTDADGDTASLTFTLEVKEPDTAPSFGSKTIASQSWTEDSAITSLVLPAATGGNGTLGYTLSPALPSGLSLDASTRTVSGTPGAAKDATTYTWTVADADGDTASLTFTITVEAADTAPSFGTATVANQSWTQYTAISAVTLPAATGGDGALSYTLSPALPSGVSFDATARTLSGRPSAASAAKTYTLTVADADTNTASSDTDTVTFSLTVAAATEPSFVGEAVAIKHVVNSTEGCLAVESGTKSNGQNVKTEACDGSDAQKWRLERRTSGSRIGAYKAVSHLGGGTHCLDNRGDFSTDGRIGIWSCVSDTHGAAANQSVWLTAASGGGYNLTFTNASTEVALWAYRTNTDVSGEAGQKLVPPASLADTAAVWMFGAPDTAPAFGSVSVASQGWTQHETVPTLVLPAATGGDGTVTYSLSPTLPSGVSFDATTRTISGRPTAESSSRTYTLTATDADGDTATLTFSASVGRPSFVNKEWVQLKQQAKDGSIRCLDIKYGAATLGTFVQTVGCNGTDAQKWKFERRSNGKYTLVSKMTTNLWILGTIYYCVDNRGTFDKLDHVHIYSCHGDNHASVANQLLTLESTSDGDGFRLKFSSGSNHMYFGTLTNGGYAYSIRTSQATSTYKKETRWYIDDDRAMTVSVADAQAHEDDGALDFQVTLSRTVRLDSTVTVSYTTRDVTATAGSDYTATSGKLTFEGGERSKTVSVPVLDDSHEDDGETMELVLSSPTGASISDGTGVGTINNQGAMVKDWLARFGRTVADHVLDGVKARLDADRTPGTKVSIAGHSLGADPAFDAETAHPFDQGAEHTMSERELLLGSSFALTGEADASGGTVGLWARAAQSSFDGKAKGRAIDGEVTTGMLGADYARESWLVGLMVSHSNAEGGDSTGAEMEASLTAATGYGALEVSPRVQALGRGRTRHRRALAHRDRGGKPHRHRHRLVDGRRGDAKRPRREPRRRGGARPRLRRDVDPHHLRCSQERGGKPRRRLGQRDPASARPRRGLEPAPCRRRALQPHRRARPSPRRRRRRDGPWRRGRRGPCLDRPRLRPLARPQGPHPALARRQRLRGAGHLRRPHLRPPPGERTRTLALAPARARRRLKRSERPPRREPARKDRRHRHLRALDDRGRLGVLGHRRALHRKPLRGRGSHRRRARLQPRMAP